MLDKRKSAILRAVVESYVENARPVGSQVLAKRYRLKVSPATVRNDMAVLEELGYIKQPHTSAGRVPTDMGYRWYIDNWPGPRWPDIESNHRRTIDAAFRSRFGDEEEVLEETSHVLSDVTQATAVVVGPPSKQAVLRRLEMVERSDGRITLLLVATSGEVEQGVVELPKKRTETQIRSDQTKLNKALSEVSFDELPAAILKAKDVVAGVREAIADAVRRMVSQKFEGKIFRDGTAKILAPERFGDLQEAHGVVDALEHPALLGDVMEAARKAGSTLVFIGSEIPVEQMQTCAVIFAPFSADEARHGTLGVVGPTRMDYPHTISAVGEVARALSKLFDSLSQ